MSEHITDLTLLKVFAKRDVYERYHDYIRVDLLEPEIRVLLEDFGLYFKEFNHDEIDLDEFPTWFHHYRHPDIAESKHQIFKIIFTALPSVKTEVTETVLSKFQEKVTAKELRQMLDDGFDIEALKATLTRYEEQVKTIDSDEDEAVIHNSLDTILKATDRGDGLTWRLDCLNEAIGPLNKGKFIIAAAYVDVGKTMFAVSEATHMARQLEEGCVLWLNNEEDDLRVYRKIWKSVLGMGDLDLMQHKKAAVQEYKKRMHGDLERIKFIDIRRKNVAQIAELFKKYKPKLAVIDQVDKVTNKSYKSFSDHDRLKNLYSEVRALANEYCPILAISQADVTTVKLDRESGDIEYQLYPHHRQLDGSKVGKPGEADAIIMIGRRTGYPNTRGIHVSKNKFGDQLKQEVIFNGEHARYENP